MNENEIGELVVKTSIEIHRNVGPGLLERVYEAILARQLEKKGLNVKRQLPVPIRYEDETYDEGFRADLIVNDLVILELKSVEELHNSHKKQLHTYLRLSGLKVGYLLNFSNELMKDGITRIINGYL